MMLEWFNLYLRKFSGMLKNNAEFLCSCHGAENIYYKNALATHQQSNEHENLIFLLKFPSLFHLYILCTIYQLIEKRRWKVILQHQISSSSFIPFSFEYKIYFKRQFFTPFSSFTIDFEKSHKNQCTNRKSVKMALARSARLENFFF
jgi:hypothetical protein